MSGAAFWMDSVGMAEHREGQLEGSQTTDTCGPDPRAKPKLEEVVIAFVFPRSTERLWRKVRNPMVPSASAASRR